MYLKKKILFMSIVTSFTLLNAMEIKRVISDNKEFLKKITRIAKVQPFTNQDKHRFKCDGTTKLPVFVHSHRYNMIEQIASIIQSASSTVLFDYQSYLFAPVKIQEKSDAKIIGGCLLSDATFVPKFDILAIVWQDLSNKNAVYVTTTKLSDEQLVGNMDLDANKIALS